MYCKKIKTNIDTHTCFKLPRKMLYPQEEAKENSLISLSLSFYYVCFTLYSILGESSGPSVLWVMVSTQQREEGGEGMFQNSFMDFTNFHPSTEFITYPFAELHSHHHQGAKHTLWFVKGQHLTKAHE